MNNTQFFRISKNDVQALVKLSRQTFWEAYIAQTSEEDMNEYLDRAFSPSQLLEEIQNPKTVFYFVQEKNQRVGYLKMRWDRTPAQLPFDLSVEIERFYLLQDFYGQGLGQKMLDFCEALANKKGFVWMWLLVWPENKQGLRFYQKNGFEQFATKGFEFGGVVNEDWLMRKAIVSS